MKKRATRRVHHRKTHIARAGAVAQPQYLVFVRGWMFLVMFALMLGLGAVVGTAINNYLASGQVAGVAIEQPLK